MRKFKKIVRNIIFFTPILLLSGCFTEGDLKTPIKDYLSSYWGINEDFTIRSTTNNWFEGGNHETIQFKFIELNKYKLDLN